MRVVFGSKGGRPRDASVFDKHKVVNLLNEAIRYIEQNNGKLIEKPTLHQALDRYHNVLR